MAPIRRYLRISKYSVLECRIYLDNPALAHTWLLNPRDPVLPKVIESVRPLVLPKLREERERSRKKSTKKRGIKDIVVEDDFEVSIFLTETSTRHSLLYKHKHFRDTTQTKLTSNSAKLTGASREAPIDVDVSGQTVEATTVVREEDPYDDAVPLRDIPTMDEDETAPARVGSPPSMLPSKRRRGRATRLPGAEGGDSAEHDADVVISDDGDDLFVGGDDSDGSAAAPPPAKRRKDAASPARGEAQGDDKKKLAMDIRYEGFSIYGRVLCLVVKKREGLTTTTTTGRNAPAKAGRKAGQSAAPGGGQAVMENWITSTQMPEVAPDDIPGAS
ncbi:hypothetical protein KVR01_010149 [Diaporthe batatas]|uniref:uncharacterized protein n=1 Tax=Diaporthe batatas TaxID=748121 RepID=UPI001D05332C|nr:uncharacterized protein KVR01_010149 [Diaporthe batatas]KAG8159512.1 hypothetical protein KVR01_010149 [Diaporthe batatas]